MDLKDYFSIIKKRLVLFILITLICTISTAVYSYFFLKPQYKSSISIFIGNTAQISAGNADIKNYVIYQELVQTYIEFLSKRSLAQDVIDSLNLNITPDKLISKITATQKENTQFIDISVISASPDEALSIANQLPISLKKLTSEVMNNDFVKIVDSATYSKTPFSPNLAINTLVGFAIGILVSIIIIFTLEYFGKTKETDNNKTARSKRYKSGRKDSNSENLNVSI